MNTINLKFFVLEFICRMSLRSVLGWPSFLFHVPHNVEYSDSSVQFLFLCLSSGVQILQIISGCGWDENTGEVTGVIKYGWNGADFLEFDVKTLTWIALNPEALITKQTWDTDRSVLKHNENFLTQMCPTWLKMYVDSGNFSLQRTGRITSSSNGCSNVHFMLDYLDYNTVVF